MQRTGAHDQRRIREFEEFLEDLFVVPVSQSIAEVYARERSLLRSNGLLIPDNDIWIAATAIAHNLQLVSGDEHFARIDGLLLYPLDRE
jgi:predicted nucleic acid-binding protein